MELGTASISFPANRRRALRMGRAQICSRTSDTNGTSSEWTAGTGRLGPVVGVLLSVTFACGLVIAVAHVLNNSFVAPVYDVAANLTAFSCAVAASLLLDHWVPAMLSAVAIGCWLILARRTILARRR